VAVASDLSQPVPHIDADDGVHGQKLPTSDVRTTGGYETQSLQSMQTRFSAHTLYPDGVFHKTTHPPWDGPSADPSLPTGP